MAIFLNHSCCTSPLNGPSFVDDHYIPKADLLKSVDEGYNKRYQKPPFFKRILKTAAIVAGAGGVAYASLFCIGLYILVTESDDPATWITQMNCWSEHRYLLEHNNSSVRQVYIFWAGLPLLNSSKKFLSYSGCTLEQERAILYNVVPLVEKIYAYTYQNLRDNQNSRIQLLLTQAPAFFAECEVRKQALRERLEWRDVVSNAEKEWQDKLQKDQGEEIA